MKIRWSLKVNPAERRALRNQARKCPNTVITVRKAAIGIATTSTSGGTEGTTAGGGNDPRFDYCYQATAQGYGPYKKGRDPEYAWYTDADRDGWVCE